MQTHESRQQPTACCTTRRPHVCPQLQPVTRGPNALTHLRRSTYHGGCLPSALELFCDVMLAPSGEGDVFSELQQQSILFVNSVVRDPGYRGKTAAGATLTPAARQQVLEST